LVALAIDETNRFLQSVGIALGLLVQLIAGGELLLHIGCQGARLKNRPANQKRMQKNSSDSNQMYLFRLLGVLASRALSVLQSIVRLAPQHSNLQNQ
jgi:hypothetical protein